MDPPDAPAPVTGSRLQMLKSLGYDELMHDSHVPFLSHLIGVRRLLVDWGCPPALCDAGLFHSVYGTEFFQPTVTATRQEVEAVIGPQAERLAWLWCNIKRDTLDPHRRTVQLRRDDSIEALPASEIEDIATLWAADTIEQIGRMAPDERAFAGGIGAFVRVACHAAQRAFDERGLARL